MNSILNESEQETTTTNLENFLLGISSFVDPSELRTEREVQENDEEENISEAFESMIEQHGETNLDTISPEEISNLLNNNFYITPSQEEAAASSSASFELVPKASQNTIDMSSSPNSISKVKTRANKTNTSSSSIESSTPENIQELVPKQQQRRQRKTSKPTTSSLMTTEPLTPLTDINTDIITSAQPEAATKTNNNDQYVVILDDEPSKTNKCIDLTKEDDCLIINSISRPNKRRLPNYYLNCNLHGIRRIQSDDANTTIILDDDGGVDEPSGAMGSTGISRISNSANLEFSQEIGSPSKRNKTSAKTSINLLRPMPTLADESAGAAAAAQTYKLPQCPICLENLDELKQNNKRLMSTTCGHILCSSCLDEHYKTNTPAVKTINCPTCRTKLTKTKIHSLYL